MSAASINSRGRLVATMLAGSWRPVPAPLDRSASELEEVAPLLLKSGAAALFWRRIRNSDLRTLAVAREFQQVHRQNILRSALQQQTIQETVALLSAAGVEPVLVKGRAAALLYPEEGLRPCGDVDLCVRPADFQASRDVLKNFSRRREIDLHRGFENLGGGCVEEIYARTRLVEFGAGRVRVLSDEDHLRVLCIHLLREGAWRPLWLCDVAAAVESRRADFDWGLCIEGNRRWSNWVNCALGLAHELLGANIEGTPAAASPKPLPRWLVPIILKEWESLQPSMAQRHTAPMSFYKFKPAGILSRLRHRWPNPIEATMSLKSSFNELPRFPFQVGSYLTRGAKFAARLSRLPRGQ